MMVKSITNLKQFGDENEIVQNAFIIRNFIDKFNNFYNYRKSLNRYQLYNLTNHIVKKV